MRSRPRRLVEASSPRSSRWARVRRGTGKADAVVAAAHGNLTDTPSSPAAKTSGAAAWPSPTDCEEVRAESPRTSRATPARAHRGACAAGPSPSGPRCPRVAVRLRLTTSASTPATEVGLDAATLDVVAGKRRQTSARAPTWLIVPVDSERERPNASDGPEHPRVGDLDGDERRDARQAARGGHSVPKVDHRPEVEATLRDGSRFPIRWRRPVAASSMALPPTLGETAGVVVPRRYAAGTGVGSLPSSSFARTISASRTSDAHAPTARASGRHDRALRSFSVRCATTVPTSSTMTASTEPRRDDGHRHVQCPAEGVGTLVGRAPRSRVPPRAGARAALSASSRAALARSPSEHSPRRLDDHRFDRECIHDVHRTPGWPSSLVSVAPPHHFALSTERSIEAHVRRNAPAAASGWTPIDPGRRRVLAPLAAWGEPPARLVRSMLGRCVREKIREWRTPDVLTRGDRPDDVVCQARLGAKGTGILPPTPGWGLVHPPDPRGSIGDHDSHVGP